jgi:hypothetical protein
MKLLQSITDSSRAVKGVNEDAYVLLSAARKNVENLLADCDVLETLDDDIRKGNITTADYYVTRKKTITDFYSNRTELLEDNFVEMTGKIPEQKRHGILEKLKSVVTNSDFITTSIELISVALPYLLGKTP